MQGRNLLRPIRHDVSISSLRKFFAVLRFGGFQA